VSTGEYTARGSSVVGKLAFARAEVASLAPSIDSNRDGYISAAEVESSRGVLKEKVIGRIAVTAAGATCAPVLTDAALTEQDGLLITGRWDCPASDDPLVVDVAVLDDLARGHRHVARVVSGDAIHDEVLYGEQRSFSVPIERSQRPSEVKLTPAARAHVTGFRSFFQMGIEHILTGYDHLVFILGLVLVRARLRSLLAVVTAFTIAHSITLAIAVLGIWTPSPRIVEPAIALSIVYVGIENLFVSDASKRYRITFPFGLVHGFGFAGALRDVGLGGGSVPSALVSFNLGVEAGQLAVLAVLLPLVLFLRDRAWFEPRAVRILSGAVALAGGIWFITRVVGG
jgi:hydrogenase/urease accessory protein HupE